MTKHNEMIVNPISSDDIQQLDTIEALFFAYRDFVSDPDRILQEISFGRAHHRVLYFVNRKPGLSVAELLDILQITKQSLARVLKELIEKEHIIQAEGENDRRKRLLYPTQSGRELILALSKPQSERIGKALENMDEPERERILEFLRKMVD